MICCGFTAVTLSIFSHSHYLKETNFISFNFSLTTKCFWLSFHEHIGSPWVDIIKLERERRRRARGEKCERWNGSKRNKRRQRGRDQMKSEKEKTGPCAAAISGWDQVNGNKQRKRWTWKTRRSQWDVEVRAKNDKELPRVFPFLFFFPSPASFIFPLMVWGSDRCVLFELQPFKHLPHMPSLWITASILQP